MSGTTARAISARWRRRQRLGCVALAALTGAALACRAGGTPAPLLSIDVAPPTAGGQPPACDLVAGHIAASAQLSDVARALIAASLERHEGTVVRWASGRSPLRVWIEPRRPSTDRHVADRSAIDRPDTDAAYLRAVQHALRDWDRADAGVALRVVRERETADVRIWWTPALQPAEGGGGAGAGVDGRSAVQRSAATGAIETADVYLSEHDAHGHRRSAPDIHAMAIHEIGHVLGLSHAGAAGAALSPARRGGSTAPNGTPSIMAARVTADEVTTDDHRALRAWYALPLGLRCRPSGARPPGVP